MQLKKGITIHSTLPGIAAQVTINEGSMKAGKKTGLPYAPGSSIPKTRWRNLQPSEEKKLIASGPFTDFRKNIFVGEVPAPLKRSLAKLELHECTAMDQVIPAVQAREKEVKEASKKLETFLRPFSSTGQYKFHRITRALPGWPTITRFFKKDTEETSFIGLHIDQSRVFTPYTASRSDNRVSINLSKETRHLALINLTLIQAVHLIRERSGLPYEKITAEKITGLFFKYCPEYPVVKLALKPYQYYVAPTDNFIHDATTLGNRELDVTIVYVGMFDMPR